MNAVRVIPCLDMKDGRVVKGVHFVELTDAADPVEAAEAYSKGGADEIAFLDITATVENRRTMFDVLAKVAAVVEAPLTVGGGIKSCEDIEEALASGASCVSISSAAFRTPELVKEACRLFRESIIVGIDTREGWVAIHGWQQETRLSGIELAKSMVQLGVRRFIYTDISRDGTLTEPNFSAFSELRNAINLPVIASGGVSSLNHLRMLKQLGAEGAIVGKALYTGDINLKQALATIS